MAPVINSKAKCNDSMRVLYSNVDSFFEILIRITKEKPDIIGLTEIRAKNERYAAKDVEYEIPHYDMFLNEEPKRGIAMYFAKELNAQLCVEFADNKFQEQLWCTVRGGNDETVLVGCIYRSPNSDDQNNTELFNMLKSEKMSKFNKICIFGDFNFPDVNWDGIWNGNKSNEIIENFRDALLIQKVTNPTRFREGQKRTMDDLVFVNEESLISDIEYGDPLGKSDHLFLSLELYVPKVKTKENSK